MDERLTVVVKSNMYVYAYKETLEDWFSDSVGEGEWEGCVISIRDKNKIQVEVDLIGDVTVESVKNEIENEFEFVKSVEDWER